MITHKLHLAWDLLGEMMLGCLALVVLAVVWLAAEDLLSRLRQKLRR